MAMFLLRPTVRNANKRKGRNGTKNSPRDRGEGRAFHLFHDITYQVCMYMYVFMYEINGTRKLFFAQSGPRAQRVKSSNV